MSQDDIIRLQDNIFQSLDIGTNLFLVAISLWKWKRTDMAGRFLTTDFLCCFIWNYLVLGQGDNAIPNLAITHLVVLIDFVLTFLFFNFSNAVFRKNNIGIYICSGGILFWLIDSLLIFKGHNYLTFFEPFTYLCEIIAAIIVLVILLNNNESGMLRKKPSFWFTILILFNAGTLFFFSITRDVLYKSPEAFFVARVFDEVVTYIFNIGMGLAYLLYPKKHSAIA